MIKKRIFTIFISFLLIISLTVSPSGCSLFSSKMQPICVVSDPDEAEVMINGNCIGKTPVNHQIHRGQEVSILVKKVGYRSATRSTYKELSTVGVLDIIGGSIFLFPFFGLISAGAWEQTPSNFSVVLEKEGT